MPKTKTSNVDVKTGEKNISQQFKIPETVITSLGEKVPLHSTSAFSTQRYFVMF